MAMRPDKYIVQLSKDERHDLQHLVSTGKSAARMIRRAQILMKADAGWTDQDICEALEVCGQTVHDVRKQYVQEGMKKTLERKSGRPASSQVKALDGVAEAHLVALTCSEPPEGHTRWTLRLLADRMVALEYVEKVSYETVRHVLKKTNSSLGANKPGASRRGTVRHS
jgi:transposase